MSKECIVLSSDEEIQIIGEIKEDNREADNVFKNSKLANTIKRFSGNTNVELSIKLEDDSKEDKDTAPVNLNGKICISKSSDERLPVIRGNAKVKSRSPSPKVYVIEDDTPQPSLVKVNHTKLPERSHPPGNSLNSNPPPSVGQPKTTPVKAKQKSPVAFVSNEILIIEDNSDENSDDDCKILSTSIMGPSEDPLLVKEQSHPNQKKIPTPRIIRRQEGTNGVKTIINQSVYHKELSIVNGRIVRRNTLENKENTLVNPSLCKSRESLKNTGQIRASGSNGRTRQSIPSTSSSATVTSKNIIHNSSSSTSNAKSIVQYSCSRNTVQNTSSSASNSRNASQASSASSTKQLLQENIQRKYTFDELVKLCGKVFQDRELETRLWRYYNEASEDIVKSDDFYKALETAITSAPIQVKNMQEKIIISRNVKEVIRLLKRQPGKDTKKLRKLNRMLGKINDRIRKLEEMEVTSDEDEEEENIYVILDRHRARAAKIYNKICELEGKAAHAGRAFLQKFNFSGTSQYPKIEHALEKYFNKTRIFPDFFDVKKLIEATVEKEKYHISPKDVHNMAQSLFVEFGDKLQRRRQYDDYTSLVDYLDDGTEDPAQSDEQLKMRLEDNKKHKKKEQEVLEEYTRKQAEFKIKEPEEVKTDVNDTEDDEEEEGSNKKIIQFTDTEEELLKTEDEASRKRTREIEEEDQSTSSKKNKHISDLEIEEEDQSSSSKRNKNISDLEEVTNISDDCSNNSGGKKESENETDPNQFFISLNVESVL